MQTTIGAPGKAESGTVDERWAAWVARGVENDRRTRKRAIAVVAAAVGGLGLWMAMSLRVG